MSTVLIGVASFLVGFLAWPLFHGSSHWIARSGRFMLFVSKSGGFSVGVQVGDWGAKIMLGVREIALFVVDKEDAAAVAGAKPGRDPTTPEKRHSPKPVATPPIPVESGVMTLDEERAASLRRQGLG